MKHTHNTFSVSAALCFTASDLAIIRQCAEQHYDGVCKFAAKDRLSDGRPGFIAGLCNTHRSISETSGAESADTHENWLSFREIDTMAKCLEIGSYFPDKTKAKQASNLGFTLHKVLQNMNSAFMRPVPVTVERKPLPEAARLLLALITDHGVARNAAEQEAVDQVKRALLEAGEPTGMVPNT